MATCDCDAPTVPYNSRSVRSGTIIHNENDVEWVLLGQDIGGNWCVLMKKFSQYDTGGFDITYLRKYDMQSLTGHFASETRDKIAHPAHGIPLVANTLNPMMLDEFVALLEPEIKNSYVIPITMPTDKTLLKYYNRRLGLKTSIKTATVKVRDRAVQRTEEEISELFKKVSDAVNNPGKYWYEAEKDKAFVRSFVRLRREAGIIGNLLISGPSGSGKTEGIIRLGEEMGVPVYVMNCAIITTPEKWIGRRDILADGTTVFNVSEHLKWIEGVEYEPGIILYDEINRLHPDRTNVLYSLLDGQRKLYVPDAARHYNMHPANIVIATANIGSAFSGTFGFDRALRERFNFTQERRFPPTAEEIKILTTATGIEKDQAKTIVSIMNLSRRDWERDDLESPVSTRTGLSWATLVASGHSIVDAAEYTAVPLYKDEGGNTSDRAKFRLMISSKLGTVDDTEEG